MLILFATINIYEATLIGLAAYLNLRHGHRRDALQLVILEAFFLVDITFLSAEISTRYPWLGPALAVFSLTTAAVKLAAIVFILRIGRSPARIAFILIQIAAILAIPLIFSRGDNGSVSPLKFFIAWWVVGLMPAVYAVLKRWLPAPDAASQPVMVAIMWIAWLSLVAHLGILHYVYDVSFYSAMSAPMILSLALVLNRGVPERVMPRKDILTLRIVLPIVAVLVSASSPEELSIVLGRSDHLTLTTMRLAVMMSYLELVYSFFRAHWVYWTLAGAAAGVTAVFGPTWDQMIRFIESVWNRIVIIALDLFPSSQASWGAIFVVLAFVFLAIGAAVSVRRRVPAVGPE